MNNGIGFYIGQDIIDYLNRFDYARMLFEDDIKWNHAKLQIEDEYRDDPMLEAHPGYKEDLIAEYCQKLDYEDTNGEDDLPMDDRIGFTCSRTVLCMAIKNNMDKVNEILDEGEIEKLLLVLNLQNDREQKYLDMILLHLEEVIIYE